MQHTPYARPGAPKDAPRSRNGPRSLPLGALAAQSSRRARTSRRAASAYPVTVSVAVIPGWIVHPYWMVPALVGVNENVWPLPKSLDLKLAPDWAVTLWLVESSLVQVTFWPTLTVVAFGSKAMFCILMATPPPEDDAAP